MQWKRVLTFLSLLVIWLACSWAVLQPGFFRVHDYVHGARIAEMARGWSEGQLPVRWSGNFGFGYGMPLFLFYAPLPYYAGALVYWLTSNLLWSVKFLFLFANVGTLLGSFLLGKKLGGRSSGLLLAATYTLAPYRAVNLYIRGAISEIWGMMALPWILWSGLGLVTAWRDRQTTSQSDWRKWWAALTLSLTALMLSHNLSAMMFVPISGLFLVVWVVLNWWQKNDTRSLGELITSCWVITSSYLVAVGCASFYLWPALLEKDYTKISSILGGYFHYSQHFLYLRQFVTPYWGYGGSNWGPDDGLSFFLGWGLLIGLVLTSAMVIFKVKYLISHHQLPRVATWLGGAGVILVMSLFLSILRSKGLWDTVPGLSFIQFPWRWLSVTSLAGAMIIATLPILITTSKTRWLVTAGLLGLFLMNTAYFRPEAYMDDPSALYYADEQRIQAEMSSILPDYIPKQMPDSLILPAQMLQRTDGQSLSTDKTKILVNRAHQKLFQVNLDVDTPLIWSVADFPGWRLEIDGQPVEHHVSLSGQIAFTAPKGDHLLGLSFTNTFYRNVSDAVTVVSWLVLLIVSLPVLTLAQPAPSKLKPSKVASHHAKRRRR
jgi:hypothetical protein